MSYRPDFRTNYFDLVPLDWMDEDEFTRLGPELNHMVMQSDTQDLLAERHLDGVIARHADIVDSVDATRTARELHVTTNNDFYGILLGGEEWIGMASVVPSLPLRAPMIGAIGLLPAGLTRKHKSLSVQIPTDGPNLTAWVGAEHHEHLADAYGKLGEIATFGWTIEPVAARQSTLALHAAGYKPFGPPQRFDDMETSDRPPRSQYFVRTAYS